MTLHKSKRYHKKYALKHIIRILHYNIVRGINKFFKKKEKIKRELPPGTIRKEFHFEGNVQNIGFRFEVQSHAKPLGITGYAKNNDDGSVTAQLQGSLENIDKVILSLQNIDRIQIDSITEKDIPLDYYENDFYIQY